jgi:hypothetical protein
MRRKVMIRKTLSILTAAVIIGTVGWSVMAQNQRQFHGQMQNPAVPSATVTIEGVVDSVNMAIGQGIPSFVMIEGGKKYTIVVGPYRLLLDENFQINQGMKLSVKAFASIRYENTYAAVEIRDLVSGAVIKLRSEDGTPIWSGNGRRGGQGGGYCMGGNTTPTNLELAAKTVIDGKVESVNMGLGRGFPVFTLRKADGSLATIIASPFWAIQQAEFKISLGDVISAIVFPSQQHENAFLAMELLNLTTGVKLKLRDDDGLPIGGRNGSGQHLCGNCLRPGSF